MSGLHVFESFDELGSYLEARDIKTGDGRRMFTDDGQLADICCKPKPAAHIDARRLRDEYPVEIESAFDYGAYGGITRCSLDAGLRTIPQGNAFWNANVIDIDTNRWRGADYPPPGRLGDYLPWSEPQKYTMGRLTGLPIEAPAPGDNNERRPDAAAGPSADDNPRHQEDAED